MEQVPSDTERPPSKETAGPAFGRRVLLRGGAAAAPVLLTLASGPVAASNTCVVASSFVSVATFKSRNPSATLQCSTKTCESWRTDATTTSSNRAYLDSTTVTALLGSTSPASSYANASLSSALAAGSGIQTDGELGVLQHLIALCLNVKTGNAVQPGNLTQSYVGTVWKNYKQNGNRYLLTTSGINWTSAQVVSWARLLIYPNG